jgi:hypothetical protein
MKAPDEKNRLSQPTQQAEGVAVAAERFEHLLDGHFHVSVWDLSEFVDNIDQLFHLSLWSLCLNVCHHFLQEIRYQIRSNLVMRKMSDGDHEELVDITRKGYREPVFLHLHLHLHLHGTLVVVAILVSL